MCAYASCVYNMEGILAQVLCTYNINDDDGMLCCVPIRVQNRRRQRRRRVTSTIRKRGKKYRQIGVGRMEKNVAYSFITKRSSTCILFARILQLSHPTKLFFAA